MVCNINHFTTFQSTNSYSVKLPNGELTSVTHLGIAQLTDKLILNDGLCVPAFDINLLSTKKPTQQLNCYFIFSPEFCFIQDLLTGTAIGKGKVMNGLYYLVQELVPPIALAYTLPQFTLN